MTGRTAVGGVALRWVAALLELIWLWPALVAIDHAAGAGVSVLPLLALLPAALCVRLAVRANRRRVETRPQGGGRVHVPRLVVEVAALLAGGACVAAVVWIEAAVVREAAAGLDAAALTVVVAGGSLLWLLGTRLGSIDIRFPTFVGEFQFGLVMLLVGIFAVRQLRVEVPASAVAGLVYIVVGLAGMSLARRSSLPQLSMRGRWWLILVGATVLVVLGGAAVAALVTPDVILAVGRGCAWVWHQMERGFAAIGSLFPADEGSGESGSGYAAPGGSPEGTVGDEVLPESVLRVVRVGFAIFAGLMALIALYLLTVRAVAWAKRQAERSGDVRMERLSAGSGTGLRSWLARCQAWVLQVLRMMWRRGASSALEDAEPVRRLYREVLRWGATRGHPRHPAQTPEEYGAQLGELYPQGRAQVAVLTAAYVHARYGPGLSRSPADGRDRTAFDSEVKVEALREAWHILRTMKPTPREEADGRNAT